MDVTDNYSLNKPTEDEKYSIEILNTNADIIDAKLKELYNRIQNISIDETDPTVPNWAKQTQKPSYSKSEIGLPNVDNTSDINKPVSTAQKTAIDDAIASAKTYTDTKISNLINGAPETMDTLKEVSDAISENKTVVDALNYAIGNKVDISTLNNHISDTDVHITSTERTSWDEAVLESHKHSNKSVLDSITSILVTSWNNAVTHISDTVKHITSLERTLWNTVSEKVDAVEGKGLSTNDLTSALKSNYDTAYSHSQSKHATVDAEKNIIVSLSKNGIVITPDDTRNVNITVPTKISELNNDSGYVTTNTTYDKATQTTDGLFSKEDKKKLDGIANNANAIVVDSELSSDSINPIQNKIIKSALDNKAPISHKHVKSDISDFPSSLPANGGNSATVNGHTVESDVPANAKFTDTVYTLPTASSALGGVKTTSKITSTANLTACPIISGVVYYKESDFSNLIAVQDEKPTIIKKNMLWI